MPQETVIVLDFGGQYNQLIARRVRECGVYCEVKPYTTPISELRSIAPIGLILTGGPGSVYAPDAPKADPAIFELGIPVLGICYGCQLMAQYLGGSVIPAQDDSAREYGRTETFFDTGCTLFAGLDAGGVTWMSHGDYMERVPEGFKNTAHTAVCPNAAIADEGRGFYGVQFHPEVNHTERGTDMIRNFLFKACGASGSWSMGNYKEEAIKSIREKVGSGKVLLALSGGVDSSVAAALLSEAVGDKLTAVFVDHGLLRKNEAEQVEEVFSHRALNFVRADARDRFLIKLAGVTEPERKRRIIGEEFIRVFEAEAKKIGAVDYLAQGTIYPDVIESGAGDAAVIKSHHNVGGLPAELGFESLVEPLRMLFKDEVRKLGLTLGLPESLVYRQPFPGPGLAIRVVGELTPDKVRIVRESDLILREEMAAAGLDKQVSQYFTVLTGAHSVGVMGDERTYAYAVALRAVTTDDFMTADVARLPYELLGRVATRIVGEVAGCNRVLYDVTTKPPASIEWE